MAYAGKMVVLRHSIGTVLSVAMALSVCAEAFAATRPSYDKKMQLGQLLYLNGNFDQAIKAFRLAAELNGMYRQHRLISRFRASGICTSSAHH